MTPIDAGSRSDPRRSEYLRVFGPLVALAVLPWSIQTFSTGGVTLLFAWGLASVDPPSATTLLDYLLRHTAGLPDFLLAWPLSVVCYVTAILMAVGGRLLGRVDDRVTAGLLGVAGVAQLSVARGFSVQPGRTAWPAGTVLLWVVAWHVYRADRRRRKTSADGRVEGSKRR